MQEKFPEGRTTERSDDGALASRRLAQRRLAAPEVQQRIEPCHTGDETPPTRQPL